MVYFWISIGFFAFYYSRYDTDISVLYVVWAVDVMMNCICLYLNFTFADKIYIKCCGLCHGCCQNTFEFCAAKKILKDHLNGKEQSKTQHINA